MAKAKSLFFFRIFILTLVFNERRELKFLTPAGKVANKFFT